MLAPNVLAALKSTPAKAFTFSTIGRFAAIGRRAGMANILGFKFSDSLPGGCGARAISVSCHGLRRSSASLWTGRWTYSSPKISCSL